MVVCGLVLWAHTCCCGPTCAAVGPHVLSDCSTTRTVHCYVMPKDSLILEARLVVLCWEVFGAGEELQLQEGLQAALCIPCVPL